MAKEIIIVLFFALTPLPSFFKFSIFSQFAPHCLLWHLFPFIPVPILFFFPQKLFPYICLRIFFFLSPCTDLDRRRWSRKWRQDWKLTPAGRHVYWQSRRSCFVWVAAGRGEAWVGRETAGRRGNWYPDRLNCAYVVGVSLRLIRVRCTTNTDTYLMHSAYYLVLIILAVKPVLRTERLLSAYGVCPAPLFSCLRYSSRLCPSSVSTAPPLSRLRRSDLDFHHDLPKTLPGSRWINMLSLVPIRSAVWPPIMNTRITPNYIQGEAK